MVGGRTATNLFSSHPHAHTPPNPPGKIVFFLMQVCKAGVARVRKICLTRHGESLYNLAGKLGGDYIRTQNLERGGITSWAGLAALEEADLRRLAASGEASEARLRRLLDSPDAHRDPAAAAPRTGRSLAADLHRERV